MSFPPNRPSWPQQQHSGWSPGAGHSWQGGQWPAPQSSGGQPSWQQQGAWRQQGAWHQPPKPSGGNAQKKILGILLVACLVGAIAFVGLLLFSGEEYEFDDYEAPPATSEAPDYLMVPVTDEEAWALLQENPIYNVTTPASVNCEMAPVDPVGLSDQQLQDHMNVFSSCLMRVWDRPMTDAGITMFRPMITVYSGPVSTGCGTQDHVNAFYCGADQMIYYHSSLHQALPDVAATPLGVETVLAHEFAHFQQGRSGIFGAYVRVANSMSERDSLELTRRVEVQADCLSAQWTRANVSAMGISDAVVDSVLNLYYLIGDDQLSGDPEIWGNHGHGETRRAWGTLGLNTSETGVCNSFAAPAAQVR